MNIVKTILTIGLASAMMQSPAAPLDLMGGNGNDNNPLLQPSTLPFGAPDAVRAPIIIIAETTILFIVFIIFLQRYE